MSLSEQGIVENGTNRLEENESSASLASSLLNTDIPLFSSTITEKIEPSLGKWFIAFLSFWNYSFLLEDNLDSFSYISKFYVSITSAKLFCCGCGAIGLCFA